MKEELHEYLKYFLSPNNPILFSLLFVILLAVLVYFISKYIILPLNKKHQIEKHEIELKSSRLMALFAELDPDPIIRIDPEGQILLSNLAAKELIKMNPANTGNIVEILPFLTKAEIKRGILSNEKFSNTIQVFDNHYTVLFVGNSNLDIAQVYFRNITKRKILEDRLKKLGHHLQEQIEEERNRIASELHDSIGQGLLLTKLKIQNMEEKLHLAADDEISDLDVILQNTISELKTIIYNLRPKILDELGLGAAVTSLVHLVSEQSGIKGSLNIHNLNGRPDKRIELFTFRLAQETLNNIIKHSDAEEFNVILQENKNNLRLIVSDNGKGFNQKDSGTGQITDGFGLLNMKERVESFGGELKIDSTPGVGTVIMATIPLRGD